MHQLNVCPHSRPPLGWLWVAQAAQAAQAAGFVGTLGAFLVPVRMVHHLERVPRATARPAREAKMENLVVAKARAEKVAAASVVATLAARRYVARATVRRTRGLRGGSQMSLVTDWALRAADALLRRSRIIR